MVEKTARLSRVSWLTIWAGVVVSVLALWLIVWDHQPTPITAVVTFLALVVVVGTNLCLSWWLWLDQLTIRQLLNRHQHIVTALQDVYYRTDLNGTIIEISPSITKYIGLKPSDVIGRPATDFYVNPEDRAAMLQILQKDGRVVDYVLTMRGLNDRKIYAMLNAHFFTDAHGQPRGIEGVLRDVTREVKANPQLDDNQK